MTAKPTKQIDTLPALRHAVYRDLLDMLPIASYKQAERFVANLALARPAFAEPTARSRDSEIFRVMQRFTLLCVTPDLATVKVPILKQRDIELFLERKYGDRLRSIAGFYKTESGRWRVNLPEGCAMYGYRSMHGFFAGVLCQPLNRDDFYFLLSSSKFDGPKAMRMTDTDRRFFERFKEPTAMPAHIGISADISGHRWTGRRFVLREKQTA